MSMEDQEKPTIPDMPDGWRLITDLRVSGGRIHLRDIARDRHGIDEGDILDVIVRKTDGSEVYVPEVEVGDRYRVLIPSRRRNRHDITGGDIVDVAVRHSVGTDG